MGKRIVIALGGNALGNTLPEQAKAVKKAVRFWRFLYSFIFGKPDELPHREKSLEKSIKLLFFLSLLQEKTPFYGTTVKKRRFIMDEEKAIYTGMTVGGVLGSGAVIVGTFVVPVVGPFIGSFLFIGGMIGGAVAGGNAGLKIVEKVNRRKD